MLWLEFEGGGNLTLALGALFMFSLVLPFRADAQKSASCGSSIPCVQVGLEDGQHPGTFETDAGHFLYCAEGETLSVAVLAKFNSPTLCSSCDHTPVPRQWTWSWQGGGSPTPVTTVTVTDAYTQVADIELVGAEAGDTITITCTVENVSGGDCYEDHRGRMGTHTASKHLGATATCTVKLWRLDLEANKDLDPVSGYPHYISQFASNVAISADAVGTSIYQTDWTSIVDGEVQNDIENGSSSWSGKIVASTGILCWATVWNQCDLTNKKLAIGDVTIHPSIRRPGWTTEVQLARTETDWLDNDELAFPQVDWSDRVAGGKIVEVPTYGRNANARSGYEMAFTEMVVPIYSDSVNYTADYNSFGSMRDEITSGPNMGLFYNTNNALYEVNRQILSNYWIKPTAGKPTIPADHSGNSYTNWLGVFEAVKGADCKCLDPGMHGGTGTGTYYRANLYHEGNGNPSSPNGRLIGHQSRLEDGYAAESRAIVDPVYRCDLLYDNTEDGLRGQNEGQRAAASANLSIIQGSHAVINDNPAWHSFKGDIHIYTPAAGWADAGKGTF